MLAFSSMCKLSCFVHCPFNERVESGVNGRNKWSAAEARGSSLDFMTLEACLYIPCVRWLTKPFRVVPRIVVNIYLPLLGEERKYVAATSRWRRWIQEISRWGRNYETETLLIIFFLNLCFQCPPLTRWGYNRWHWQTLSRSHQTFAINRKRNSVGNDPLLHISI